VNKIIVKKILEYKTVIIELNEPSGNQFSVELLNHLKQIIISLKDDESINSVILTGNERIFSVGGDIFTMKKYIENKEYTRYIEEIVPLINEIIMMIVTHPLPFISLINGSIAGGGIGLAFICDHKVAKPNVKISVSFSSIALTPDSSTSVILPNIFGYSRSLMLIGSNKITLTDELYTMNKLDAIGENSLELALKIAMNYKDADRWIVSNAKRLFNIQLIATLENNLKIEYDTIKEASKRREHWEKVTIFKI